MHEGETKGIQGFGKEKGKRQFGRPSHKWEILKWILKRIRLDGMYCISFAQDKDKWQGAVNMVINHLVPQNAGSF
jgi:hypothetical protein